MNKSKLFQLIFSMLIVGNVSMYADNNSNSGNDNSGERIPIVVGNQTSLKDKSLTQVPFYAYYQDGIVYIGTTGEFTVVDVTIENTTTGTVYTEVLNITDCTDSVDISTGGAGSYTLEIETEYGDEFVGSFTLY